MNLAHHLKHPVFKVTREIAGEENLRCFVIGGFVRDLLLDRPTKDIDIVIVGNGLQLAEKVGSKLRVKKVSTFQRFGTAHFRYKDLDVEFVGARKESYSEDSRKPAVENGTLDDDQKRRDFTINALAIDLHPDRYGELVDPFDGLNDLEQKRLKTPLDPVSTYSDDPLRMLRAIRFAVQLGFSIEGASLSAIKNQNERIKIISKERISDELNKIMHADKPSRGFILLQSTGLLSHILPELEALMGVETRNGMSHKDNFYHTLEVLDNVAAKSNNLWLRWAALLHDIAKAPTKRFDPQNGWTFHGHEDMGARMTPKIFKRLKLPLDHQMKYVQKLVRLHLRPVALVKHHVTDSAIRRLLFEAGDDIDDLMLLCKADITSKNEWKVKKIKQNYNLVEEKLREIEEKDRIRNFQPPVKGEEIMQLCQLPPGAMVGELKNEIKDAILEGIIPNEKKAALVLLKQLAEDKGLSYQSDKKH